MRAIPIENHYTIKELEYFAKKCKNHRVERKARAIIMVLLGFSRTVAARSQGVGTQTVRDWVLAYSAEGLDGLQPAPNQGRGQVDCLKMIRRRLFTRSWTVLLRIRPHRQNGMFVALPT